MTGIRAAGPPVAIDVALLLAGEAAARAVELNRQLDGGQPEGLTLDATHLPHLTLVQLFVGQDRLEQLARRVEAVAARFAPLDLRVRALDDETGTAMLVFEPHPGLQRLHEALMDATGDLETAGGADAFCRRPLGWDDPGLAVRDDRPARDRDVRWVATYRADHARERFLPHVTVGHGRGAGPAAPFAFRARRLAVCHLGRFCTCRAVLHEYRLASAEA